MSATPANVQGPATLEVAGLNVSAGEGGREATEIVRDVSFSVASGRVLALIGESGSGKTTISLACMGYTRPGCVITGGSVRLGDEAVLEASSGRRRELRGGDVAYIAQSAAASFNGALTLNRQVTEAPVIKGRMSQAEATERAVQLYRDLDLPDPEHIGRRYPHQLSGGQLQRMMAAMAMVSAPKLLILDEPTTALDVTTQIEVLRAFKRLVRTSGTSAIYVSHDLAVVAQMADDVLVLKDGRMVEFGSVESIIEAPRQAYTRELIGAAHVMPKVTRAGHATADGVVRQPLLRVEQVSAGYGRTPRELALRGVTLEAFSGRTLGLIGESGSGKTTLGRVVSGLMKPASGHVTLNGKRLADEVEQRSRDELRAIQFAFQMADVALNPRHTIETTLSRPLAFYFGTGRREARQRVEELLGLVELPPDFARRYPRQLSGGERQRVNLARALAAEPELIICDEVTSALDTVVASAILALLRDLQKRLGVGYVFISHDISTIARISDEVAVLRRGEVVAFGAMDEVLSPPWHPYTELLLKSVPDLRTDWLDTLV